MDPIQEIKDKVDQLLTSFRATSLRQKIHLGLLALVAAMVIVSFFFIKSSFGKSGYDHSAVDSLQAARVEIAAERQDIKRERDSLHAFIAQHSYEDNLMLQTLERQNAYISSINAKLSNLQDAYKDLSHYSHLTNDELAKFFADLK